MIIIKILCTKARSFGFHKRSRSVVLKHKWFCPQGDIRGSRDTTQIVMRAEGREGVAGQQRIEVMDADQHLQCRKIPPGERMIGPKGPQYCYREDPNRGK